MTISITHHPQPADPVCGGTSVIGFSEIFIPVYLIFNFLL
jgi:hypothetical protein